MVNDVFNPQSDIVMGGQIMLKVGEKPLGGSTSSKVTLTRDMKEISCKEMGAFKGFLPGKISGTGSSDNYVSKDIEMVKQAMIAGTLLDFLFAEGELNTTTGEFTPKEGGISVKGKALVNQCDINAPDADVATYTVGLQLTGDIS